MLFDRTYQPTKDELIFHYCDPDAFFGITQNRRLWFSDVFSMNDFMEMHWGYSIFKRAMSELLKTIPKEFFDRVDDRIAHAGSNILPVVSCFSLDGDVLSQWRAYADDGSGFAIGFSAEELVKMAVRPLRVLYDDRKQVDELKALFLALHEVEKADGFKYGEDFNESCTVMTVDLCALKNPAFQEEKEVRLVHAINFVHSEDGMSLKSVGGTAWGRMAKPEEVKFRMKREVPVPYVPMDFSDCGAVKSIKKIVLGPRNRNLLSNISIYLNTIGLTGIQLEKSAASYS